MAKKYNLKLAVVKRFLRTALPQVPAVVAYLVSVAGSLSLPEWVVPLLVFVGACLTALDKFLREVKFYERLL